MPLAWPPATEIVTVGKFLLVLRSPAGADVARPGEEDQLGRLPSIERQFDHALVVHDLADPGRMRFDHRRVGGDRHLFADDADRQRDIQLRIRADLEDDAVLHVGVEALQRHLQLIRPDGEVRQHEGAVA